MSWDTGKKRKYIRPHSALNNLSFEDIVRGESRNADQVGAVTPTAPKLRPSGEWNSYAESTGEPGAASFVMCSGNLIPIVIGGNSAGVGVLKHDAIPGEEVKLLIEGEYLLRPDWEGASSPSRTAISASGLMGKAAYYIVETGTVSDVAPNGSDYYGYKIGYFTEDAMIDPPKPTAGGRRVAVRLDYSLMQSNTAVAQVADAANNNNSNSMYVNAYLDPSGISGLIQTLSVDAISADPNYPVEAANITWTFEGTTTYTGFSATHTFAAGAGKTIACAVTVNGTTVTKNYTVTISASAAPASFVEV